MATTTSHELVEAAAKAGADIVKFQTFKAVNLLPIVLNKLLAEKKHWSIRVDKQCCLV